MKKLLAILLLVCPGFALAGQHSGVGGGNPVAPLDPLDPLDPKVDPQATSFLGTWIKIQFDAIWQAPVQKPQESQKPNDDSDTAEK